MKQEGAAERVEQGTEETPPPSLPQVADKDKENCVGTGATAAKPGSAEGSAAASERSALADCGAAAAGPTAVSAGNVPVAEPPDGPKKPTPPPPPAPSPHPSRTGFKAHFVTNALDEGRHRLRVEDPQLFDSESLFKKRDRHPGQVRRQCSILLCS